MSYVDHFRKAATATYYLHIHLASTDIDVSSADPLRALFDKQQHYLPADVKFDYKIISGESAIIGYQSIGSNYSEGLVKLDGINLEMEWDCPDLNRGGVFILQDKKVSEKSRPCRTELYA